MDRYTAQPEEIVIVGDFNFHFDVPHDMHVRRFRDMLYCHGMTQHVQQPTRQDGHILDLVIDRVNPCVADTLGACLISEHCVQAAV